MNANGAAYADVAHGRLGVKGGVGAEANLVDAKG